MVNMQWSRVESDATLERAEADGVVYHVCVANGLVSWWSEFGEPPTYVESKAQAIAAVETAHAAYAATLPHRAAPIVIWPFHEAPEAMQDLSDNGGDEDWVAWVSASVIEKSYGEVPFFLQSGSPFAIYGTQEIPLIDGSRILIASHG